MRQIDDRDWRTLPFDEVKAFLIFLFGENPGKTGNGIKLAWEDGRWRITFKGNVTFRHDIYNGQPVLAARPTQQQQASNGISESVNLTR